MTEFPWPESGIFDGVLTNNGMSNHSGDSMTHPYKHWIRLEWELTTYSHHAMYI